MTVASLKRLSAHDVVVSKRYPIVKSNKYGMPQERIMVVDIPHRAIRFLTTKEKIKSEFPFSQIAKIQRTALAKDKPWDTRKAIVYFMGQSRKYQLKFKTLDDIDDFCATAQPLLDLPIQVVNVQGGVAPLKRSDTMPAMSRRQRESISLSNVGRGTSPSTSLVGNASSTQQKQQQQQQQQLSKQQQSKQQEEKEQSTTRSHNSKSRSSGIDSDDDHDGTIPKSASTDSNLSKKIRSVFGNTVATTVPTGTGGEAQHGGAYLEYHLKKKNKYGIKQSRIIVLNSHRRSLLLLDSHRKFKKELSLADVLQVEIPGGKDSGQLAYVIFSSDQRAFQLYFNDAFDRIHFCERLSTLNNQVTIKDDSEEFDDPENMRFTVLKVNKVGRKKKRILYLDSKKRVIRSLNILKNAKDTPIGDGRLVKIEKSYEDKVSATLTFRERDPWHFIFSDSAARERFVHRARMISQSPPEDINNDSSNSGENTDDNAEISLFVGTWNVGSSSFPSDESLEAYEKFCKFLPPNQHDIYVVGLQECSKRDQWVAALKQHVQGDHRRDIAAEQQNWPAHSDSNSSGGSAQQQRPAQHTPQYSGRQERDSDSDDSDDDDDDDRGTSPPPPPPPATTTTTASSSSSTTTTTTTTTATGTKTTATTTSSSSSASGSPKKHHQRYVSTASGVVGISSLNDSGNNAYVPVFVKHLWEIVLVVLVRRELFGSVTNVDGQTVACGVGDVLGNKGAVAVSFRYEETQFCFVVTHLVARAERLTQRRDNFIKIMRELRIGRHDYDVMAQHHHIVWFGDLNYRIELEYQQTIDLIRAAKWDTLLAADQLSNEMAAGRVFHGFREGQLVFSPTYRFEKGEHAFSNKRGQAPSWTDRVLWRSFPNATDLRLVHYGGYLDVLGSDHRPLSATFLFRPRLQRVLGVRTDESPFTLVLTRLRLAPTAVREQLPALKLLVDSDFLEERIETELAEYMAEEQTAWQWPGLVEMTPFINNRQIVEDSHLRVTIVDDSDTVFAFAVISMNGATQKHGRVHVECDALMGGLPIACLTAEVFGRFGTHAAFRKQHSVPTNLGSSK
eukprot:TRINITY_DN67561_c7_g3_i1.p1 TRINITY_DN67561_c7_g3~~TRINITY_DN67561_c7_g3_i1.p1  ORF type:complete len:1104 (+),score=605.94 TRINITY_DN67561_c7_g3_i1:110-3313(+)